jgi:hypothetical protein
MAKEYLGCMNCQVAIPMDETNQAPSYLDGSEGEPEPRDDMSDFKKKHDRHLLKKLYVKRGPFGRQPFGELVHEYFYLVQTEPNIELILRGWRSNIMDPMQYEIRSGKIVVFVKKISLQEEELRNLIRELILQAHLLEADAESLVKNASIIKENRHEQIKELFLSEFRELEEKNLLIPTGHPLTFLMSMDEYFFKYLSELVLLMCCNEDQRTVVGKTLQMENNPRGAMALEIETDFQVI